MTSNNLDMLAITLVTSTILAVIIGRDAHQPSNTDNDFNKLFEND